MSRSNSPEAKARKAANQPQQAELDQILTKLENRVAAHTQQSIIGHYPGRAPKSIHTEAKAALQARERRIALEARIRQVEIIYSCGYIDAEIRDIIVDEARREKVDKPLT